MRKITIRIQNQGTLWAAGLCSDQRACVPFPARLGTKIPSPHLRPAPVPRLVLTSRLPQQYPEIIVAVPPFRSCTGSTLLLPFDSDLASHVTKP